MTALCQCRQVSTTFGVRTLTPSVGGRETGLKMLSHQLSSQVTKHLMDSVWLPYYYIESGILCPANIYELGAQELQDCSDYPHKGGIAPMEKGA